MRGFSLVRTSACFHPHTHTSRTVPPVTGPHVIPFLPTYIPPDVDINQVKADVADGGVSVPAADAADVPALRQVVQEAKQKGIDLKIVVIEKNPPIDTPLRDIATEVGHANPGSTVLAISPWFAGTYSTTFDRVTLEAGQDVAKTGDPVQSSKNFASELTTQHFPWTPFTIVVVLAVVVAVVATRILQVRGKRAAAADTASDAAD
ncbi:MAG: hypothetical protein QOD59_2380 [Mycobacterium sp.]|nr:hypothetical protein [Mycobacterium sp.]MDT7792944.1 hypothetical protein [Mycobacterium sp.]